MTGRFSLPYRGDLRLVTLRQAADERMRVDQFGRRERFPLVLNSILSGGTAHFIAAKRIISTPVSQNTNKKAKGSEEIYIPCWNTLSKEFISGCVN